MFYSLTFEWPFVILNFESSPPSVKEMQDYLTEFEALLRATLKTGDDQKVRMIIKMGKGLSLLKSLPYLGSKIEFIKKIGENGLVDAIQGTAIIVEGETTRACLEWVLSRVTLRKPYKALANEEDAKRWLASL